MKWATILLFLTLTIATIVPANVDLKARKLATATQPRLRPGSVVKRYDAANEVNNPVVTAPLYKRDDEIIMFNSADEAQRRKRDGKYIIPKVKQELFL